MFFPSFLALVEETEDKEEKELDFGDDDDDYDDVARELNDDDDEVGPLNYESSGTLKKSDEVCGPDEEGKSGIAYGGLSLRQCNVRGENDNHVR